MNVAHIKAVVFDLDGVLYVGDEMIPGAPRALDHLRQQGVFCRFATNTTVTSRKMLCRKLAGMGIDVDETDMVTPAVAAGDWLKKRGYRRVYFHMAPETRRDISGFQVDQQEPEIIVLGDPEDGWPYRTMNRLFRMMMHGADLLALHKGRYWVTADGMTMDIGCYVAGLEYVTGKTAAIVGKPSQSFFLAAIANLGVRPDECLMVGDDIRSDIGGAREAGFRTALVRTGKFQPETVDRSGIQPDLILDSVADLPALWS